MQTRCPDVECKYIFEVDESDKHGICPRCEQKISYRPLEILEYTDKQYKKYLHQQETNYTCVASVEIARFSALLEDIRSLGNVGSIFRTSDGAGFGKLYLCGITAYPPRKEIAKTSLGSENSIAWQYNQNSLSVLKYLKMQGVFILGLEFTEKSVSLAQAILSDSIKTPLCLVVGNEVNGLSMQVRDICDLICHIPMKGLKESLNVAVAYGIASYMLTEFIDNKSV